MDAIEGMRVALSYIKCYKLHAGSVPPGPEGEREVYWKVSTHQLYISSPESGRLPQDTQRR